MARLPDWLDLPQRKPTRSPNHDYNSAAGYHIVTCTHQRIPLLGKVIEARMQPSGIGRLVAQNLFFQVNRCPGVELKTYGLMPNHLHLLILLLDQNLTGRTIGLIGLMQRFKSQTATRYSKWRREQELWHLPEKLWQDSFWDRVIRDDEELLRTWEYIENNPLAWQLTKGKSPG
jgi:REP element-mobilizing transposase RayT